MKKYLFLPCLMLSAFVNYAHADEAQQHWKCYLKLKNGNMHIAYYTVSPKKNEVVEARLASMAVFAEDGVTKLKVKKRLECQLEDQPFKSSDANLLEQKIPR